MKRHFQILLCLVFTLTCLSLGSCYKYDPIRDKMNRVDNGNKGDNDKPDPKPVVQKDEVGEYLSIVEKIALDKVDTEEGQKLSLKIENKSDSLDYKGRLYVVALNKSSKSTQSVIKSVRSGRILAMKGFDPKSIRVSEEQNTLIYFVGSQDAVIAQKEIKSLTFDCDFTNVKDGDYYILIAYTNKEGQIVTMKQMAGALLVGQGKREQKTYLFSFENWAKRTNSDQYELPIAEDPFSPDFWTSASNIGYSLMPGKEVPYPVNEYKDGYKGSAVSIESRPGKITAGMGKYLVAGSLYSGEARVNKFLSKPLESTLFGQPIEEIPVKLSGYYKYKSGPKYINGETDAPYPNKKDQGTIAVVFYEAPDLDFFLDGNNLYTDKHIIAYKQHFVDDSNWDEWTPFEIDIPVTNKDLYKSIDFLAKKYKIAIVFSSSRRGDQFLGAVGSLLLIDEITLTTEK